MITSLKSLSVVLAMTYSSGSPLFETLRPQPLDAPLRGFYRTITAFGAEGVRTLVAATPFDKLDRELRKVTAPR